MTREEESPAPGKHRPLTSARGSASPRAQGELADPPGHRGSCWELASDTAESYEAAGAPNLGDSTPPAAAGAPARTSWWHHEPLAPAARTRRLLCVAPGVGAAGVLAGCGFALGHAVGASGPSGPAGGVGHQRFHDGGGFGASGPTGQGQAGQSASTVPSAILGGLFT